MDGLIAGHFFAVAFWGGIVAVELLFEGGALMGKFDTHAAATLHKWTDRYLELPIILVVVTTGLMLWSRASWTGDLGFKAGAGLVAVAANLGCYGVVERRCKLEAPDQIRRASIGVALSVVPGLPMALVALFLGGQRAGWW